MTTDVVKITWDQARAAASELAARWEGKGIDRVYGIPRGGVPPALMVAQVLDVPVVGPDNAEWHNNFATMLVVDDLVDHGTTLGRYAFGRNGAGTVFDHTDALFRKPHSPVELAPDAIEVDGWLHLPWESMGAPTDAVTRLLEYIGEDPRRDGLVDTPARVVKALREMTEGYHLDAKTILERTFDEHCDDMIMVRDIPFTSLCEHHLLPFTGTATVGYIPHKSGGVVGLSKLARLVEMHARRLQVQERMTAAIAADIEEHLGAFGVGVVVRAYHSCMAVRGVRKSAEMVTSTMLGAMREDARARAEFLDLSR